MFFILSYPNSKTYYFFIDQRIYDVQKIYQSQSASLLAKNFNDIHDYSLKDTIKKNYLKYSISGVIFLFLILFFYKGYKKRGKIIKYCFDWLHQKVTDPCFLLE